MAAKLLSFRAARIDRYGAVCRLIETARLDLDPLEAEKKRLEAEIRGWFDKQDPDHVETVHGKLYAVTIGARRLKRTVDVAAAIAKLGRQTFDRYATIAFGVLDKLIPSEEQTGIIASERSGDRSITDPVLLKEPKPQAKAAA